MAALTLQLPEPQDSDPKPVYEALLQAEAHRQAGSEENALTWLRQAETLCTSSGLESRRKEISQALAQAASRDSSGPGNSRVAQMSAPALQVDEDELFIDDVAIDDDEVEIADLKLDDGDVEEIDIDDLEIGASELDDLEMDDSDFKEPVATRPSLDVEDTIDGLGPSLKFDSAIPSLDLGQREESQSDILIGVLSQEMPPSEPSGLEEGFDSATQGAPAARVESFDEVDDLQTPQELQRLEHFTEVDDLQTVEELKRESVSFAEAEDDSLFGAEPATTPLAQVDSVPASESIHSLEIDETSPAEYANASIAPISAAEQNDLEEELGIDLSLNLGPLGTPQSRGAPTPAPPSVMNELSEAYGGPGLSAPAEVKQPDLDEVMRPQPSPRLVMDPAQPFGMAPSANLPQTQELDSEVNEAEIIPPSRPSRAPTPDLMLEPPPSYYPPGTMLEEESAPPLPSPSLSPLPAVEEVAAIAPEIPTVSGSGSVESQQVPPLTQQSADTGTMIGRVDLLNVEGLGELPEEDLAALAKTAQRQALATGEESSDFSAALVLQGEVKLMPLIMDASCATAGQGEILFTQGNMKEAVALRVVAAQPKTEVALISKRDLEKYLSNCPWVADELRVVGDRLQAFAGALLGPLGESLDEFFRDMVLQKCSVKRLEEGEFVAHQGEAVDGLYLLGAGELIGEKQVFQGDLLFADAVLSGAAAGYDLKAGPSGALLLYADRMSAHELLATCPPFLELLGSAE